MKFTTSSSQAFPEALFHQLLKAMVHPDHKTRIGAHRIFSVVLVPTSVCPHPSSTTNDLKKEMGLPRSLSRTASVFSSSTALFEKLRKENILSVPTSDQRQIKMLEEESGINSGEILDRLTSPYSQAYRSWNQPVTSVADNSELVHPCNFLCVRLYICRLEYYPLGSQLSFRMVPRVDLISDYIVSRNHNDCLYT